MERTVRDMQDIELRIPERMAQFQAITEANREATRE